jgi:protein-histidine pros-kinase
MTAHALKEDRQRCLDVGMDDYLAKPVHRDALISILKKYCG